MQWFDRQGLKLYRSLYGRTCVVKAYFVMFPQSVNPILGHSQHVPCLCQSSLEQEDFVGIQRIEVEPLERDITEPVGDMSE